MRYYVTEHLSPNISETPEGYLLCVGVPIARIGVLEYASDEVPIDALPGSDRVRILRQEADVFDTKAMASFEGKPVTIDHPDGDVTPATWSEMAKGHAQNVRRGEGVASDLLLADLLITDQEAIEMVRGGLREISCGYDADYEQEAPGQGRQQNIRGNHVALVTRGRCGPRCRINDNQKDNLMNTTKKKEKFTDRLARLFGHPQVRKVLDSMEAEPEEKKEPAPPTDEDPDRLAKLEAQVQELAVLVRQLASAKDEDPESKGEDPAVEDEDPEAGGDPGPAAGTGDKARDKDRRTTDSRVVDRDTEARATLLYPGIRVADTDGRCTIQRVALRAASKDKAVDGIVRSALRGSTLDACDCVTLDAAFVAASEFVKARNNLKTTDGLTKASARDFGKAVTPADINKANREFYAKRGM